MMKVLLFVISAVTAYLISGINPSIMLSTAIYGKDIRTLGSKNPGFTNFVRCFSKKYAWLVFLLDITKSILPCALFGFLFGKYYGWYQLGVAYTGMFAMLGHAYPVWYGFKGGKAFLVGAAAIWMMDPGAGLIATAVFGVVLLLSRYMSLASISAAVTCPFALAIAGSPSPATLVICTASSAFLIFRHKENIKRLAKGTETPFIKKKNSENGSEEEKRHA